MHIHVPAACTTFLRISPYHLLCFLSLSLFRFVHPSHPALQAELAKLRKACAENQEQVDNLNAQVAETTEQLTKETEGRFAKEEELSRCSEALESVMQDNEELKTLVAEQGSKLSDQTEKKEYWEGLRNELSETNRKYEDLLREKNALEWELLR